MSCQVARWGDVAGGARPPPPAAPGCRGLGALERTAPQIAGLIRQEERYQLETVRLIPSENYAAAAVLEAMGSVLTNKYSEGYPGKRYYEGQRYIDQLETLVQE